MSVLQGSNRLFLLLFLANGFSNFVQFAASLILARSLGPEQFGVFSFFVAFAQSLSLFIDLGLCATLVRLASGKAHPADRRQLFIATAGVQTCIFAIFLLVLLPLAPKLLQMFQQPDQKALYILAVFMAGTIVLQWLIRTSLETSQKVTLLAGFTALYAILRSVMFALAYFQIDADLQDYFLALYLLPLIITCLIFIVLLFFRGAEQASNKQKESRHGNQPFYSAVGELFHYGKWMFSQPIYSMLYLIPIYILASESAYELGIYSAAFTFSAIFPLVNTSVRQITMPKVSRFTSRAELNDYIAKVRQLTLPAIIGIVVVVLAMAWVMIFILDERYAASFTVFCVLGTGMALTILLGQYNIISHVFRRPDLLMLMTIVEAIVLLFFCAASVLWLEMGALGAAISVATVLMGGEVWLYFRLRRLRNDPKAILHS